MALTHCTTNTAEDWMYLNDCRLQIKGITPSVSQAILMRVGCWCLGFAPSCLPLSGCASLEHPHQQT